jgi:hypothetical protein
VCIYIYVYICIYTHSHAHISVYWPHTHTHTHTVFEYRWYQIILPLKCFYTSGAVRMFVRYLSLGHRRGGGDWTNTWHWTERFTFPAVNGWPKCPDEIWTSAHPLPSTKGGCVVFVTTTERFALDLAAYCLSLLVRERTVNTFWRTSV